VDDEVGCTTQSVGHGGLRTEGWPRQLYGPGHPSVLFHEMNDMRMRLRPRVYVLPLPEEIPYPEGTPEDRERVLMSLAEGLASSPAWNALPDSVLVVRPGLPPELGIIGFFDNEAEGRIEALATELKYVLPHLRYVGYEQAERDAELLAERLVERFGEATLHDYQFCAIPRGGLIVLGMVAYALGLRPDQLSMTSIESVPRVVIDDCALSGTRFYHYLRQNEGAEVIFAHLYSHPDLRKAIESSEPRVLACVSARDLCDHAPALHQEDYSAWKARWAGVSGRDFYWSGQPDHLCFPWSEPDIAVINPVTEKVELGWRLAAPALCLKNRIENKDNRPVVQVQREGKGPLQVAPHVIFGRLKGQVVIGDLQTETCYTLEGTAADIWEAVAESGSIAGAESSLYKAYDVDASQLKDDVRAFVNELLAQRLLVKGYGA